ncbi:MAG TPA: Hpt domain-containing protein, partial [Opitutales bacterium]|nr:Hpt domain-containing protein [Opitutales bacterium]
MNNVSPIEESLLDLFRTEAEAHTAAFDAAVAGWAAGGAKKIETARDAVRGLNGAARLVGLDKAVQLTQAMEEFLTAAREHKRTPSREAIDGLRRGVAWLRQFAQLSATEMMNLTSNQQAELDSCLLELGIFAAAEGLGKEAKSPRGKRGKSEMSKEVEAQNVPRAIEPKFETPNSKLETAALASKLDFSLLDMYRTEADTQLAALAQGVVELEGDLANPKKIEPVMRAAHSLKGAARIIGLDLVSTLTHVMEDALVAAQKGKVALAAGGIDALLRAGDWLAQFSQLPQEQLAAPSADQIAGQAACLEEMRLVLAGKAKSGARSGERANKTADTVEVATAPAAKSETS